MPTLIDQHTGDAEGGAMATAQPAEDAGPALSEAEGFQTGRVLTIGLAHAMNDTYTSFLAPLLPGFIAKLALSKTQAGLLAFLQSSPSLLQPVIGHLADRLTLRYLVILAPAVTATMMSLLGVAPRYLVLALLVMLAGLSSASLHAIAPAMAGRVSGRSLGRGMGIWMVGGILGYTLGPLIVVSVVNLLTLEGTPWLMVGGWFASVILYLRLRDVPGRPPVNDAASSWRQGLQALRPVLAPVMGITVARGLMIPATITFLPTFLIEEGATLWFAGAAVSIVTGAGVLGSLLGGLMSDRLGRRLVVSVSMAAPSPLMFLFLGVSGWARVPVLLLLGVTMPATQVVLMAVMQESCPDNRALATGIYHSVAFITEAGAAVVLGALGDLFGLRPAFAIAAVVLLLGLPFLFWLPGKR